MSLLLGPTNTPLCSIIVFPTPKPRPGAGMQFSLGPRVAAPPPLTFTWGGPGDRFFKKIRLGASVRVLAAHRGARSHPKSPWDAQGRQNEAPKLTFGRPGAPFLVKIRDSGPLTKTPLGAMFSSHLAGPGASIFTHFRSRNRLWDAVGSWSHLFLSFCGPGCANMDPRGAAREPKVAQRPPKVPKSLPGDVEKSMKNRPRCPRGCPGCPGRSRGTPPIEKTT